MSWYKIIVLEGNTAFPPITFPMKAEWFIEKPNQYNWKKQLERNMNLEGPMCTDELGFIVWIGKPKVKAQG